MSAPSASAIAPSIAPQSFHIRPFSGAVGAEIIGLDLALPVNDEDFARIHRAHLEHHVVVFRDQRITPEQQIAFSRRFGVLQIHVLKQFLLTGHPEILIVSNVIENGQAIGLGDAGKFWHSDLSYKELPSLGSMLHAQELPAEGGDTLFADMHHAWDTLPQALRQAVEGRSAAHSYTARQRIPIPRVTAKPNSKAIGARLSPRNNWRRSTKWCIRSYAPTRKMGARRCLSVKASPPASSACLTTKAVSCWLSSTPTACARKIAIGINGNPMIWCFGITVR